MFGTFTNVSIESFQRKGLTMTDEELARKHPLATKAGLGGVLSVLLAMGAMCPECGHGTRKTSKNWAVCKQCGARIRRGKVK